MKNTLILTLLLLISHCGCQYLTSPDRTETVIKLCAPFQDRNSIISEQDKTQIQQYNQVMKSSFSMTGNELIMSFINNRDNPMLVLDKYPQIKQEYGIFVGPFIVGLIILISSSPYMCCCCCCPGCCPPSKCCRKQIGDPYSRVELIWPGVVLLLALGLILAAGAIGLSKTKDIENTVNGVGCSVSITIDDLINGNVTKTQKFFVGVKTLNDKITDINGQISVISAQFGSASTAIGAANTKSIAAINAMSEIPTGTAGGKMAPFDYNSPLNVGGSTTPLPSIFPDALGSSNAADSSSAIYLATDGYTQVQNGLNQVKTAADNIVAGITGSTFTTALTSAQQALSGVVDTLQGGDQKFYETYSSATSFMPTITTAMTGIYAGFIGLAVLGIIPTLFLLICSWFKCRYLLYFTCCIFLLVGIISFFVVTLISALIPIFYFTCDFSTFTLSSAANFNQNFGQITPPQYADYTSLLTKCLNGQSGDVLQSSILGDATTQIADFKNSILGLNQFDSTAIAAGLQQGFDSLSNLINGYFFGNQIDFIDSTQLAILNKLSDPSNYAACESASTLFAGDSWIPTTQSPKTISCKSSSTNLATGTQCPLSGDVTGPSANCHGCMDITQILIAAVGRAGNLGAQLGTGVGTRYPFAACSTFVQQFTDTVNNYYAIKMSTYSGVMTNLQAATTPVNDYITEIGNVGISFTNAKNALDTALTTVVDPNYGLVAGLNCAIIGEDILLVNNVACMHGFKLTFFIRAAFGIAGFGILISMCCMVCTGVRHFKQSQVKKDTIGIQKFQATEENINPQWPNTHRNQNLDANHTNRPSTRPKNIVQNQALHQAQAPKNKTRQIQMNYVDNQRFQSVKPPQPMFY